jgi:hypothetical protein
MVLQIKDLDLLNPMRELIYEGKVFRQPEGTISSTWVELNAFLLVNYCESRAFDDADVQSSSQRRRSRPNHRDGKIGRSDI